MKVGVFYNINHSGIETKIKRISKILTEKGLEHEIYNEYRDINDVDCLIVLGGDGTILRAANTCAQKGIKILGINYGTLGFLTEFEEKDTNQAIELLLSGDYKIEKRTLMKIQSDETVYYALNDVVVSRESGMNVFYQTANITAQLDGYKVDDFKADGVIVATPSGSTAYSLSAGGSILSPNIGAFILTPISAHSLHSRPIVFSDSSTLVLSFPKEKNSLILTCDGVATEVINNGKEIVITKAPFEIEFIQKKDSNFYNKLLYKMSRWSI